MSRRSKSANSKQTKRGRKAPSSCPASVAQLQCSSPLTIGTASYGYTRNVGARGGQTGIGSKAYGAYNKKRGQWAAQIRAADKKAAAAKKRKKKHRKKGKK